MPKKNTEFQLSRYDDMAELFEFYHSWVQKNGIPDDNLGCVCCAELICYVNCQGITDSRVKKIEKGLITQF